MHPKSIIRSAKNRAKRLPRAGFEPQPTTSACCQFFFRTLPRGFAAAATVAAARPTRQAAQINRLVETHTPVQVPSRYDK